MFGSTTTPNRNVVDPVVQAMTLTDIVVSATVTALLLALAIQVNKRQRTVDPNELVALKAERGPHRRQPAAVPRRLPIVVAAR